MGDDHKYVTQGYVRDPHREWIQAEGVRFVEDLAVDLRDVHTEPWPRLGVKGVIVKLTGSGDFLDLWLVDIPAKGATEPQRHLFEEVVYVIAGHGTTSIDTIDGRSHTFEWGPKSMFAIPLNARYQHFNTSARERCLLASTTDFPLVINLFHDERFVFENTWDFQDRIGPDKYFKASGDFTPRGTDHRNIWETNFVPDLGIFDELRANEERGAGSSTIEFILADGTMHAHMSEIPVGRYKKAHRHEAGFHIFCVTGSGYSLLWPTLDSPKERVDWSHGVVFCPPEQWYHQHFNVSTEPARYLATFLGSNRYPLTLERRATYENRPELRRGGGQIEYEDEDPAIYELFAAEVEKEGLRLDMDGVPVPIR